MSSKKFRKLFSVLIVLVLCLSLVMVFCACGNNDKVDDDDDKEEEPTETVLVTNGDFETSATGDYPQKPSTWSGTSSTGTKTDKLVSGVINTGSKYESNKSKWDDLANPEGEVKDNNILMIYNKDANVYTYTNTFTTAIGGYYKLTARIKLVDLVGDSGAYFKISDSNMFGSFGKLTSTDGWETFTYYIEGSRIKTSTVTITLSLGTGSETVKGYALFDDVVAEKVTYSDYTAAKANNTLVNTVFASMLQPEGEMAYYTNTSDPYTPGGWSTALGTNDAGKSAPSSWITRGIMDTSDWDVDTFGVNPGTPFADDTDTHILYINNYDEPSASGYTSKSKIRVDLGTLYKLSIWVKCTVEEGADVDTSSSAEPANNLGATVKLTGTDDYSVKYINTTSQSLNNGWALVSFYIFGNQYRSKDFTIELWLGQGGDDDATLTMGYAYFDKLTYEAIETFDEETRTAKVAWYSNPANVEDFDAGYAQYSKVVNLVSINDDLVPNNNFDTTDADGVPTDWDFSAINDVRLADGDVILKVISNADLNSEEWTTALQEKYGLSENPLYPYTLSPVLLVNHVVPTAYQMVQSATMSVQQNLHYRLAVWVKTIDIAKSDNLTINLVGITDGKESTLSSFSINTADYENELTNDYVELVFYIQGSQATEISSATGNSNALKLSFSYGEGDVFTPASYKSGAYCIANINMEQITYTEYTNATTDTYNKTYSYSSNSATVTNGNFNSMDLDKTEIDQTTGFVKYLDKDGNEGYYTGAISSWTNNAKDAGTSEITIKTVDSDITLEVNDLIAGIININNGIDYLAQFGLTRDMIYNSWDSNSSSETTNKEVSFGAPNLAMITTRGEATVSPLQVLKSPSMSLSSNSYYVFKAYSKVLNGAKGQILLTTTSTDSVTPYFTVEGTDGWMEYVFVVKTGMQSVTAYFEIYFGEANSEESYSGTMLLDSFSYTTINQDKFNELSAKESTESTQFTTVTFDNNSTSATPAKPSDFSGSGTTSSGYVNSDSQVAGVFVKNHGKYESLGILKEITTTDDNGTETTEDVVVDGSQLTANEIFTNAGMENGATCGNYLLMINNREASYYTYTSNSLTIATKTYYKFSLYARTAWLKDASTTAKVYVTIGDDTYTFEVNTSTYDEEGNETYGNWTKFSFYIWNGTDSDKTGVKLSLKLGSNSDGEKVAGYLFIDNVSMATVSEEEYTEATATYRLMETDGEDTEVLDEDGNPIPTEANLLFRKTNKVIEFEPEVDDGNDGGDDNGGGDDKNKINTTLLWTYITSISIAAILIVVIVVWLIRRYMPARKIRMRAPGYDRKKSKTKSEGDQDDVADNTRDTYKD